MRSIDWYIEESSKRENVSMSYTKAFCFDEDDVVLVAYSIDRENVEEIANRLRKLKECGVNTPLYLDYKKDEENKIYYVLQEKAKGIVFSDITRSHNVEFAANIPVEHYSKFISDVISMHGLGIELRPRNYFYDQDIGFTIIDIQGVYDSEFDKDSLEDVDSQFMHIFSGLNVNSGDDLSDDDKRKCDVLNAKRKLKIVSAFETSLPGFKKFKRWIIRKGYNSLSELESYGYVIPDLSLTDEEKDFFNNLILEYIDRDISEVMDGVDSFDRRNQIKVKNILEPSISYYVGYEYKNFDEQWNSWYLDRLKAVYLENRDNRLLEEELIQRIMKKMDPVRVYDSSMLYDHVKVNLENFLNGDLDFMIIGSSKK